VPKQQARQWYQIVTAAAGSKTPSEPTSAEVLIYDYIDPFGVSAQDFVNDIKALDVDELVVRINSPGGSAFDGIAIFNALKRHPAQVTTYNDGLAASAASFIAQAGDRRVTSKYAETMVHGPSAISIGMAGDMRAVAAQLDKLGGNMAQLYADACGGKTSDWMAAMDAETWYTGAEAVEAGLFDEVDESDDDEKPASRKAGVAAAAAAFDYSMFRYAGRQAAPAPFATATAQKENPMADPKPDQATTPTPDIASTPQVDRNPLTVPAVPVPVAAVAPATPQARVAPEGTVIVDAEVFATMQEQARMGAEAHATLQAQAHATVVDAAIDKGKITPARRDHFLAMMKADPDGTTTLLNETLQEAAIPLTEMGHASAKSDTDPVAQSDLDSPLYKGWMA
jgi:ATP-dependent protease ClpP protease subunit